MATAEIILITVIALVVVLPGIAGVIRGTFRSLLVLLGLLLGAVLVDGWQRSWQNWIVATFETADPALLTWIAAAGALLAVFLIIGYGAPLLLPRRMLPQRLTWRDRLIGLLIGLVTGLLVAGYLLHYAATLRPDTPVMALIDGSLVAQLTWAALPWFMLGLVGILGLIILVRGLLIIGRSRSEAPPAPAEEQPSRPSPAREQDTATADDDTYEPTPLPGTRDLPNDDNNEENDRQGAPAQAEPAPAAVVPDPDASEPATSGTDATSEPAPEREKNDDERDDAAPERR